MRVARRPQGAVERSETEVREEYTVMDGKYVYIYKKETQISIFSRKNIFFTYSLCIFRCSSFVNAPAAAGDHHRAADAGQGAASGGSQPKLAVQSNEKKIFGGFFLVL